ncbi:hypothetical protein D0Z00_001649 [Geotrichum galactomycetum]|uniref:Uncharacterized protein n=1 Tax=Geotrichum galactomycetum TaxID=27317 RepID=A0ACB6V6C8_9ASCO|nr:hypothetical protein D0Z00_001649 [Geotrichum candidum]
MSANRKRKISGITDGSAQPQYKKPADFIDSIVTDFFNRVPAPKKEVKMEDLVKVQEAVVTLGKSIRTILDLTPDQTHSDNKDVQKILDDQSIKLAQNLCSISNIGVLGKVEQLINNHLADNQLMVNKDFKDPLPALFFGSNDISKSDAASIKRAAIARSKGELNNKSGKALNWPPPLPPIKNDKLLRQVFTSKSAASLHYYLTDVELMDVHNERLEFLGDSIIHTISAVIIYNRFPYMHEGDLSNIRTTLITNLTLSEWAKIYNMEKTLRIYDPDGSLKKLVVGGKGSAAKTPKFVADAFEAYVGGLWIDYGESSEAFDVIKNWLEDLASPILLSIEQSQVGKIPLNYEAKVSLYSKIGSDKLSPVYETVQSGSGYTIVECRMADEIIGVGKAGTAKEAGLRAAMAALSKKNVIEKYSLKRKADPVIISKSVSSELAGVLDMGSSEYKPSTTTDPKKLQQEFIEQNESNFAAKPTAYLQKLLGPQLALQLSYNIKEKTDDAANSKVFKCKLKLDGTKVAESTGSSKKSAEKRAAYFALTENYPKIADWLNQKLGHSIN